MANYSFVPKTLAPLKKGRPMKKVAIVDIETDRWLDDTYGLEQDEIDTWQNKELHPFLVTFFDGEEVVHFDGEHCLVKFFNHFLVHKNREFVCFAHNGGKFDFIALYNALVHDPDLSRRFWVHPLLAHGSIIAMTIHDHKKHVWHFRDSFPLLKSSLASLCKSFKPAHTKLEMPRPARTTNSRHYQRHTEQWQRYCENDCRALYDIMQMFVKVIEDVGGAVSYTAPSTAMQTFRKKFLHQEIPTYFPYNGIFHNAYYGGRTEVFNMYAMETGRPYYYYDINSLYPWVMHHYRFPVSEPKRVTLRPEDCVGRCGIMECDVVAPPDLHLPILPYHDELKSKLLFPLGRWTGWYEFGFIEKAIRYGYEITPKRTYLFEEDAYLFREYVDHFYKLKTETEGAFRNIMKILLNSLYGKFAEHSEREELITDPDESLEGSYDYDDVFGYSIRKVTRLRAHQLLGIATRVTTMSELKLYEYFEVIQRLGGTIYYCDTDSIITDIRIPTGTELGGVKLEHEFIEGVFLAPKAYCLRTYDADHEIKIVLKGFSNGFRQHVGIEEFRNALPPKSDFTPFAEQVISPASLKQIHVRSLDGFVTMVQKKSMKEVYDKRKINGDLTTEPWVLPMAQNTP